MGIVSKLAVKAAKDLAVKAADASGLAVKGIRAYHGSPYQFDKFDLSKVGTGEGAQAYGHGLYFTENPKVAKSYREGLAGLEYSVDGAPFDPQNIDHLAASKVILGGGGNPAKAIKMLEQDIANAAGRNGRAYQDVIDQNRELIGRIKQGNLPKFKSAPKGSMYEVNIGADPQNMLDWDKSIDSAHPRAEALDRFYADTFSRRGIPYHSPVEYGYNGNRIYKDLADALPKTQVSGGLSDIGIPGIRYLDGMSRSKGEGTSNFVVFDPSIVDILRRYAVGGKVAR